MAIYSKRPKVRTTETEIIVSDQNRAVKSPNLNDVLRGVLVDLRNAWGISTRQLERLFGQYLERSPSKYYLEMRLQRARNLLLQSEKSVTEIAVATGFRSTTHFARVYRGLFGVSPGGQRARLT